MNDGPQLLYQAACDLIVVKSGCLDRWAGPLSARTRCLVMFDEIISPWLTIYLSADDTRLNRMIGNLALVAAVRRV